MKPEDAERYAAEWIASWNARDVEAVLAHFADDVVFSSPLAARLVPESSGVIRGKDELRRYWTEGLARSPDLRFELVRVYAGVDTVVINYANQRGQLVNEVLVFEGEIVVRGHVAHALDGGDAARTG